MNQKQAILPLVLFLLTTMFGMAQNKPTSVMPWEKVYEEWLDVEDVDNQLSQQQYEFLQDLYNDKIDINHASREDLEQLPFLSAQQVEDIAEYLYRYGEMKSPGELQMITSIDAVTRRLLLQFVIFNFGHENSRFLTDSLYREPKGLSKLFSHIRQELIVSGKIPTYKRRGDQLPAMKGGFLGYQWKHSFRYTLSASNRLKLSLVGAQDSGEPFFCDGNGKGYDYYSGYLLYRIPQKYVDHELHGPRLREIVVGRYRLRTGMGLVINGNTDYGKASMLQSLGKGYTTITGHSSRSEANYLQGAAATVRLFEHNQTHIDLTGFASWRNIDATLDTVESGKAVIATLLRTGYHRTLSEMRRRNDASQWAVGGNINWRWHRWHAGLSGLYTQFDKALHPNHHLRYRQWSAEGRNFWNLSVDYGYTSSVVNVSGETATGDCGAIATINSLSLQLSQSLSLVTLQRFYSYKFYSLLGNSFSAGGGVQNESGIYVGATWRPLRGLSIEGYADVAYFSWAKYLVSKASHYYESMLSLRYERNGWALAARYRWKNRQQDGTSDAAGKKPLIWQSEQRMRIYAEYGNSGWNGRLQLDGSLCDKGSDRSHGWMVSAQCGWRSHRIALWGNASYFNTSDYLSRLYAYERGLLYTLSVPMSYGEGIRYSFLFSYSVGSHLTFNGKLSIVDYFDRNHISTGMQLIDASSQTDVELQIRVRL